MAEHQAPARGRRRTPEEEEYAVAVRGAFPERQPRGIPNQWAQWRGGNRNGNAPSALTRFQKDTAIILSLIQSGRVHDRELCLYRSPQVVLGQGPRIDPVIAQILDIINNMAFSRRMVLDYKVKRKFNAAVSKEHERKLTLWPLQVMHLQGLVEALGGRYLRIPPLLLSPVELQQ